jgi:acetate kinase
LRIYQKVKQVSASAWINRYRSVFCYSIRKQLAGMIAALDGVNLLVFTGGIGEHDAKVRAAICDGLSWLGISLDSTRNRSLQDPISNPMSGCSIRVIPSEEDAQIAAHTWELASGILQIDAGRTL